MSEPWRLLDLLDEVHDFLIHDGCVVLGSTICDGTPILTLFLTSGTDDVSTLRKGEWLISEREFLKTEVAADEIIQHLFKFKIKESPTSSQRLLLISHNTSQLTASSSKSQVAHQNTPLPSLHAVNTRLTWVANRHSSDHKCNGSIEFMASYVFM